MAASQGGGDGEVVVFERYGDWPVEEIGVEAIDVGTLDREMSEEEYRCFAALLGHRDRESLEVWGYAAWGPMFREQLTHVCVNSALVQAARRWNAECGSPEDMISSFHVHVFPDTLTREQKMDLLCHVLVNARKDGHEISEIEMRFMLLELVRETTEPFSKLCYLVNVKPEQMKSAIAVPGTDDRLWDMVLRSPDRRVYEIVQRIIRSNVPVERQLLLAVKCIEGEMDDGAVDAWIAHELAPQAVADSGAIDSAGPLFTSEDLQ